MVDDPEEADFILAHGTDALGRGSDKEPESTSLEAIQGLHSAWYRIFHDTRKQGT